jgi:hypothetical protein
MADMYLCGGIGHTHPQSGGMWFFDPSAILLYDAMDMDG